MHHTDTVSSPPVSQTFLSGFRHALLLFSGALCGVLLFSWAVLLPRFTRFTVGETSLTPLAMSVQERSLQAQLRTMEEERIRLVLPFQDSLFTYLKEEKRSVLSLEDVRRELSQAAARVDAADFVVIESLAFDAGTRSVQISGDVRGADTGSMTVLAAFIAEVERLPFVSALERPPFTRITDPVIGMHSPFQVTFTLTPLSL